MLKNGSEVVVGNRNVADGDRDFPHGVTAARDIHCLNVTHDIHDELALRTDNHRCIQSMVSYMNGIQR